MINQSKNLLIDYLSFLRSPTNNSENISKRNKLFNILKLISWIYVFVIPIAILLFLIFQLLNYKGINSVDEFANNGSPILFLFLAGIFAPFFEELTFRLSLKFRPIFLSITFLCGSFYIANALLNGNITNPGVVKTIISLLIAPLIISIFIFFITSLPEVRSKITGFYINHFTVVFYFFTLTFGLIHIFNYSDTKGLLIFVPLITLPQILAGLALGYIRTKYGFWYGVLTHSIYNLFLSSSLIFMGNPTIIKVIFGGIFAISFLSILLFGLVTIIIDLVKFFRKPE